MTDVLYYYVTALCFFHQLFQALPIQANLALGFLAGSYLAPTGLMVMLLVYWFEGTTTHERAANQRSVLRSLVAAFAAWGVAALMGLVWRLALSGAAWEQVVGEWVCWQGPPCPSSAAAIGFAVGTTLWQRDWRWGLGCCLAAGLWSVAQVGYGLHYPVDVAFGTAIGAGLAWLLGYVGWLDRPLNAFIRLARRLALA